MKKLPSMVSAFSDSLEKYSSLVGVALADATERSNSFYFSAFSRRLQHSSHSSSYFSVTATKTTTSSKTRSISHPRFSSATTTTQEHTPSRFAKKNFALSFLKHEIAFCNFCLSAVSNISCLAKSGCTFSSKNCSFVNFRKVSEYF